MRSASTVKTMCSNAARSMWNAPDCARNACNVVRVTGTTLQENSGLRVSRCRHGAGMACPRRDPLMRSQAAWRRATTRSNRVASAHAVAGEVAFDGRATGTTVDGVDIADASGHRVDVGTQESAVAVVDDLGCRPGGEREDRCTAAECFEHDQPERLGPVNWVQQCARPAQQCELFVERYFAEIFDSGTE